MPTNLFKSRWFNKAINAIYVQEKQPLASCILHIDRGNFGSAKSGVRRNHLSTSQKSPPTTHLKPLSNPYKPKSPLPQLLTDPHKNAPFPASPLHLDP